MELGITGMWWLSRFGVRTYTLVQPHPLVRELEQSWNNNLRGVPLACIPLIPELTVTDLVSTAQICLLGELGSCS